jgi:hypothetical protein
MAALSKKPFPASEGLGTADSIILAQIFSGLEESLKVLAGWEAKIPETG